MTNRRNESALSRMIIVGVLTAIVVVAGAGIFLMSPQAQTETVQQPNKAMKPEPQAPIPIPAAPPVVQPPVAQPSKAVVQPPVAQPSKEYLINGAGATFPYPLLSAMTVDYNKQHPNIKFNYQSIGSGGGIRQHTEKTVDFGATDAPLTAAQREAAPSTLHIPVTIGSVVFAYNIPKMEKGMKITGPVIADIFMLKITKWNDAAIQALNPGVQLPDKAILVVHRSDGSGTTFVWTSYLTMVSPQWKEKVGAGTAVQWPGGLGAVGNEGVAGVVRGTEYTVGYVELAYAVTNKMAYAYVQNTAGSFVEPTLETISAAAATRATVLPAGDASWTSINLLNADGTNTYPIASFSYLLVYKELSVLKGMDKERARILVEFLLWASKDGQIHASKLTYVPLPPSVVALNEKTIKSITFEGQTLVN
jgi:phosphate ABC transporter phosphate-binding protein